MLKKYRLKQEVEIDDKYIPSINHFLEEVKPEKWKPKGGTTYFCITGEGKIKDNIFDSNFDENAFDFGNCFRTREQAELAHDKVKELLGRLRE